MGFADAVKSVFSQYAGFNGRARRSEFWYFYLFNIIVAAVLGILSSFLGFFSIISGLYSLAILVPSIAVGIRRLHDIGKSGWFYLICFIPLVGSIILLIFFAKDSEPGENQYGPNPKGL